jgi:ubiquinone/menaquinone biosynthesis C-methylase UbiE
LITAVSNRNEQEIACLRVWSESAPYWDKYASVIRAMFEPLSDALIEDAALLPGISALDVATGTGEPALRIAETCGALASVTCTDPVVEMIAVAKREAHRRRLHNVKFARSVAAALPFRAGCFDAVVCRLGAMFFADPVASLRQMLRVLAPGGRLALAVWHRSDSNPFFQVALQIIARYVQLPATLPDAPGAFRYAEPGKLAGLVAQAGAAAVSERVLGFRIEAPIARKDFWPLRFEMSETLRTVVPQLSPGQLRRARSEVEEAIRPYFPDDRMSFPAQAIIVTAGK